MEVTEPIGNLPDEILFIIFGYLNLGDRKNCRLVSKRWMILNYSRTLAEEDIFIVDYSNIAEYVTPNIVYVRNMRIYVVNCFAQFTEEQQAFFDKYRENIGSLHIIFRHFCGKTMSEILVNWPNLQSLEIGQQHRSDERHCEQPGEPCGTFLVGPSNLNTLIIACILCQHFIDYITGPALTLKALYIYKYGYLKIEDICKLLKQQKPSLSELVLYEEGDVTDLLNLLYEFGPKLTKLRISGLQIEDSDTRWKNFVNLREISVEDCGPFRCQFMSLATELTSLTHVSLDCIDLIDSDVELLTKLPNLTGLQLKGRQITNRCIKNMFGSKALLKLKYLRLHIGNRFDDRLLAEIAPNLPNLLLLDINANLSEDGLQTICQYNQSLQYISIRHITLTDEEPRSYPSVLKNCAFFRFTYAIPSYISYFSWIHFLGPNLRMLFAPYYYFLELSNEPENMGYFETAFSLSPALHYIVFTGLLAPESNARFDSCYVINRTLDLFLDASTVNPLNWYEPPSVTLRAAN